MACRYILKRSDVIRITDEIYNMDMSQRLTLDGLEAKRANIIVGGGRLMSAIMETLGQEELIVRESDNQEGYLKYKLGKL